MKGRLKTVFGFQTTFLLITFGLQHITNQSFLSNDNRSSMPHSVQYTENKGINMARLTVHTVETAPEAAKPRVEAALKNNGFIPNHRRIGKRARSVGVLSRSRQTERRQQPDSR